MAVQAAFEMRYRSALLRERSRPPYYPEYDAELLGIHVNTHEVCLKVSTSRNTLKHSCARRELTATTSGHGITTV
jgi:hypothetical protein